MRSLAKACPIFIAVSLCVVSAPNGAWAADENVRVFQRKPFLRGERVEVAPYFGHSINDSLVRHFFFGGRIHYHLDESLSVGISVAKAQGQETELFNSIQEDFSLYPTVSKAEWLGTVEAGYAVLYGKFVLFNSLLIHFDTSAVGGVGAVGTADGQTRVGFELGLGQRFFLSRFLSLNLDLRHHMYLDELRGQTDLIHATAYLVGISLFFPDFEYKTFR